MTRVKMLNNIAIVFLMIITLFLIPCSATLAQTQLRIDPNEDPIVSISLKSTDINNITQMITDWTGKTVVSSPETRNLRMTIYSPEQMR
jgi:PBP1b-binding outer membrane lipoprotein LpoB